MVFDGAGGEQCAPRGLARDGPVGDDEQEVVFVASVAAEDGEAQVVANDEFDVEASVSDDWGEGFAGVEDVGLSAGGEEVALVVEGVVAVGFDEEGSVVEL